ncbi:MAG TPA: 30S ribosomal protein S4 [Candidatus Thermoplasmatota archaeon]|nr:30S ribosomal protein S4 [Candidatus Thermoplasmatota archaeon]
MGDPKFPRRKFSTPFHPWKADRIAEENALQKKYGLKNKKEVWRAKSHLRVFRGRAKKLAAQVRTGNPQAEKERAQLLAKLNKMGLLSATATLDDVLAMNVEMMLTRRLQTQLYLKGFTSSPNQARQFISHGHVTIGGRRMNVPGYYVKRGEEDQIQLHTSSALADAAHPARPKRAEGAGPPKLKDYTPREMPGRGGPGRGPPRGGGPGRGPPRGGGPGRGPPPSGGGG